MSAATVIPYRTMAMFRARKMVKEDIRRQGHKASYYKPAEIEVLARMYLELHPELAKQAKEDVDRLILAGEFGKRMQRALRAKLESDAQTQEPPISITSAVQISGAK
jgi:hypothetical protein